MFGIALLCASVFLFTGCKEIMSHFDNAVDSHLQVTDKLTIIGVEKTYQITKDVDYKTISDAAPEFTVDEASKGIVEVDKTTGVVKGLKSGDATIKISLPDNGLYLDATASITIKVRVEDTDQFNKNIERLADGDQILFAENAAIELTDTLDLTGKKVTIKGDKDKFAVIVISEPISVNKDFIVENVKFDASGLANSKSVVNLVTTSEYAKKKDGSTSTAVLQFGDLKFNNVEISGLKAPIVNTALKGLINKIEIEDAIVEFIGGKNIFNLGTSIYDQFILKNSTLYSKEGHTGKFIKCDGRPKTDLGYGDNDVLSTTLDHVTMYQISKGQQMNNSNGQMKQQKYFHQTMTNCILVYSGNHSAAVRGWMFGGNSTNNTMVYDKNTYWNDVDYSATWTNSNNNAGYDASGTVLTTDPNFKDPANGDFTPQGAKQVENKTGDPRWFK